MGRFRDLVECLLTARYLLRCADIPEPWCDGTCLERLELDTITPAPDLPRDRIEIVCDEDDGLAGPSDQIEDSTGPSAVGCPVKIISLVDYDQLPLCTCEACSRAPTHCGPLDGCPGPLVACIELDHLPAHIGRKRMRTRGLPGSRLSIEDERLFVPAPRPGPVQHLAQRGAVSHHFVEVCRPIFLRPVHASCFDPVSNKLSLMMLQ
ncbi:MAG: hypothetical protein A4E39_01852 [Methanoregulaceae archaeon PtaB.Bin152]|nr:MAG: hypothetical protein A4E39_01852 [Methanoregulaceae archaeon PtaB.Bin152]